VVLVQIDSYKTKSREKIFKHFNVCIIELQRANEISRNKKKNKLNKDAERNGIWKQAQ